MAFLAGRPNLLVLALPRGGVPVGVEVAKAIEAPLDIFLVRKLGLPGSEEIAMGALATGGIKLLDESLIADSGVTPEGLAEVTAKEMTELARRESHYRGDRPRLNIRGRHVILVDDGVATGYTMRVAVLALRRLAPSHVTIAMPVGAPAACRALADTVDELICPLQPEPFHAVGLWYDHFPALTDTEVRESLHLPTTAVARSSSS